MAKNKVHRYRANMKGGGQHLSLAAKKYQRKLQRQLAKNAKRGKR